jgi:hypothetical protein
MSNPLNSLTNFVKSAPGYKFQIDSNSDDKLNRLSAAPVEKPNVTKSKPPSGGAYIPKYRLLRRQDEIILQKSQIQDGNQIWIDVPTVEDDNNEMA